MEGLVALPQMAGELLFTLPVGSQASKQVGLPLVRAVSKATCGPKVSSRAELADQDLQRRE